MVGLIVLASALVWSQSDLFDPRLVEQVSVQAAASRDPVVPGQSFEIHVEVVPQAGINVYAPGNRDYAAPVVTLEWPADVRRAAVTYPAGELFVFGESKEPVRVYRRRFRIRQRVTIPAAAPTARVQALEVAGSLRYQACDDRVCFPVRTIPFRLALRLAPTATSGTGR